MGPAPSISACVPWTDFSQYVKKVETKRGASTELDDVQAGTLTLTLDNDHGFFTPGKTYSQNLLPANVATGTDTLGTTAGFTPGQSGTILQSSTSNPYAGVNALKMTMPSTMTNGQFLFVTDFVPVSVGQTAYLSGALRNTVTSGYPSLTFGLSCHFVDANRNTLAVNSWSEAQVTMAVGDGWHALSWSALVPTGAVWAQFVLVNRANMSATGIAFCDSLSITQTTPYPNQTTNGVPLRVGAVQGGNMLPYQLANVDHWNDSTTGDVESVGLWSLGGAYTNYANTNNTSTAPSYSATAGGLQFGHSSSGAGNGALAYLVNASNSRITYLAPGTYTLQYALTGVSFGSGAVANTIVNVLNYANSQSAPTLVTTNTTSTALTTTAQTVTATVTIPQSSSGLTGLEIVLSLPMVSSTVSKVTVSQFQLISGTVVPAFTEGDCYMPIFAGWVDTWITTTMSASGRSDIELDCTDQFRRLGNLNVDNAYESMILNDPHTLNYWTFNDAASTTLSSVADSTNFIPYPMSLTSQASDGGTSFGITAGATSILTVASGTISTGSGGVVHPNYVIGYQTYSSTPQSGTSFKWASGNAGNCGAASDKSQFPVTSRINANMPAVGSAGQGSFDCWIELDVPTSAGWQCNLLGNDGTSSGQPGFWVALVYNTSTSTAGCQISFNGAASSQVTIPNIFNGASHHLALTWTITAAGSLTWNFYVDGSIVSAVTNTVAYSTRPTRSNMVGADYAAGSSLIYSPWIGRISDVVLTDSATLNFAARAKMGHGSYGSNEAGHMALLLDVGASDTFTDCLDPGLMTEAWPSWSSGTVLTDALKSAATEVGGRFFMGRSGAACYNNYTHAPIRRVFQDSLGTSVDDGLQFSIDGDHIINFVTITTTDGTVYYAYSRTSIDQRGTFPLSITASYSTSSVAQSIANWLVQYHGKPVTRVYGASFTCVNPTMAVQALGLDVGSRITFNELPDSAPSPSMNFIVQSVSITGEIDGGTTVPVVAVEMSPDLASS